MTFEVAFATCPDIHGLRQQKNLRVLFNTLSATVSAQVRSNFVLVHGEKNLVKCTKQTRFGWKKDNSRLQETNMFHKNQKCCLSQRKQVCLIHGQVNSTDFFSRTKYRFFFSLFQWLNSFKLNETYGKPPRKSIPLSKHDKNSIRNVPMTTQRYMTPQDPNI